jgi:hypothetical protein
MKQKPKKPYRCPTCGIQMRKKAPRCNFCALEAEVEIEPHDHVLDVLASEMAAAMGVLSS